MKKEGEDCDQGDYFIKKGDYKGAQNYYRKGIDSYKNTADLSKIKKRMKKIATFTYKLSDTYKITNEVDKSKEVIQAYFNDPNNIDREDQDISMKIFAIHQKQI